MRRGSFATGAAAVALILSTGQAGAITKFNSSTSLRFTAGLTAFNGDRFSGQVSSPKPACLPGREIRVFMHTSWGPDALIGKATSDRAGNWAVNAGQATQRAYYATMREKMLNANNACKGDFSNAVNVGYYIPTSSTISFQAGNDGDQFFGTVQPFIGCEANRAVRVFRQVPGPDQQYGPLVKSQAAHDWIRPGGWTVTDGFASPGKYYARVAQKRLYGSSICRAGTSQLITVP